VLQVSAVIRFENLAATLKRVTSSLVLTILTGTAELLGRIIISSATRHLLGPQLVEPLASPEPGTRPYLPFNKVGFK